MMTDQLLTVLDAATRLGVNPARVRALIAAGDLRASRVGHAWLVPLESVEHRLRHPPPPGRPLDQSNAWRVIFLASQWAVTDLDPHERWRLSRIASRPFKQLAPRLRSRSSSELARVHPGEIDQLLEDDSLVLTGVSAAPEYKLDIAGSSEVEAYVPTEHVTNLKRRYAMVPSDQPNIHLRVIDAWPFDSNSTVAPPFAVALDLHDSDDQRSARAAQDLIRRLK